MCIRDSLNTAAVVVEGFEEIDALFAEKIYCHNHHLPALVCETERLLIKEMEQKDIPRLMEICAQETSQAVSYTHLDVYKRQDIDIVAKQILKTKERLNTLLAQNTGQPLEVIARDTERDNYMTAQEALAYGLIDSVIEHR